MKMVPVWQALAVFGLTSISRPLTAAVPAKASPTETFPHMRVLWGREPAQREPSSHEAVFRQAEKNARQAAEAFYRCRHYVDGWLCHADPDTGLIPRNLTNSRDFWNGRDAGADNYAFMVLTAALTDRPLLEGRMLAMLRSEQRLTARVDRLCDDYSFATRSWRRKPFDLDATVFDSAEYAKDGLIPLTEWLGPSPWSRRLVALVEDIWKNAALDTPFGRIPTRNFEVNGDLLQCCSRLHGFTGKPHFLEWAIRLGDYYLLGTNHPTRDLKELRLRDHGGEVVNGLTELYVILKHKQPAKAAVYREPLHAIFNRILEVGRNDHGMLYDSFNPQTGAHSQGLCDTWGYICDGFYALYLIDGVTAYREAALKPMSHLEAHYSGYSWEGNSADGYADSIESALNLFNREPLDSVARWLDSQIPIMWRKQQPDGVIEGWHGDGNFARTSLMYALWKTQGLQARPWREDVRVGSVQQDGRLYISLAADKPWTGTLVFDRPRHREFLHLPLDYPRINQFPEWFVVEAADRCVIKDAQTGTKQTVAGRELRRGWKCSTPGREEKRWIIDPISLHGLPGSDY
jgi:hypothetical protein